MRSSASQRGLSTAAIVWIVVGCVVVVGAGVFVALGFVLAPRIREEAYKTKSQDNVRMLCMFLQMRAQNRGWKSVPYSGKNLVLGSVATGDIDLRQTSNLEMFFSPGDARYSLEMVDIERYREVTKQALKSGSGFRELTSYGGRRLSEREYLITPKMAEESVMLICDDDDGPLHHPDGIVTGYSNGAVRFVTWEDLDMARPEDPDKP